MPPLPGAAWRSVCDAVARALDTEGVSLREALEEGARLILQHQPGPLCGSRENPHLVSPKPRRFPRCVTCGAGWADDAVAEDLEARGVDTSDLIGIDGKPHPKPMPLT